MRARLAPRHGSPLNLSVRAARQQLRSGKLRSVDLVQQSLEQIANTSSLKAYISVRERDALLKEARAADERIASGLPIAMKDSFATSDLPTTCGSRMLKDHQAGYDATVVARTRAAGGIVVGKTNMDEFSMGSANKHSFFGPVANPWGTEEKPLVAGGSSGGSAVAVASGSAFLALGGDTGGSVRLPAAYCGIVGLKVTYGRLSRFGLVAYASSLDSPGIFARSVDDAAQYFGTLELPSNTYSRADCLSGHDEKDSTSLPDPPSVTQLAADLKGVRVGVPREYYIKELAPEIRVLWQRGLDRLKSAGASVVQVSLPHTKYALPAYYIIATAEASSNLSRYDGVRYGHRSESQQDIESHYVKSRSEGFGPEVQRRILLGTFALSRRSYESYYRKAQQIRRLIAEDYAAAFRDHVDVIVTPTSPTSAYPISDSLPPLTEYSNDIMTLPASLAGLPAVNVPAGFTSGNLPLGLQLIGPRLGEQRVLSAARFIEEHTE